MGKSGVAMRLIDGLEGIVYIVDRDYRIVDFGRPHWRGFAMAAGAEPLLADENVIGHSILDFIKGPEVQEAYRRYMDNLFKGLSPEVVLPFRCDAPELERLCRLSIFPLAERELPDHLVVQSLILSERLRPRMDLFRFETYGNAAGLPILAMCSYCQNIRMPAGSEEGSGEWGGAELYYRRGGTSWVAITHTICPACFGAYVRPYYGAGN